MGPEYHVTEGITRRILQEEKILLLHSVGCSLAIQRQPCSEGVYVFLLRGIGEWRGKGGRYGNKDGRYINLGLTCGTSTCCLAML